MSEPGGVVVWLMPGAVGLHVGLMMTRGEERRFVHLAWHLQLRDDPPPDEGRGVPPSFGRAVSVTVRKRVLRVLDAVRRGQIPYGLDSQGVSVDAEGVVILGSRSGLTCASFVAVVFASVNCPLVDLGTWDERTSARRREDDEAQFTLVAHLRRHYPAHAERVAAEIGCNRLRPEEIAAASGMTPHPVKFAAAAAAGAKLAEVVRGAA